MAEYEETKITKLLDTLEGEKLTNNISKISFMFVAFLVIAGGYSTQIFSCSTQRFLSTNIWQAYNWRRFDFYVYYVRRWMVF